MPSRRCALAAASLAVLSMAAIGTPVSARDRLAAGDWFGQFITHDEEVYKTKYKIRYDKDTDELSITMINLSLSPSKFRDELADIRLEGERLSFRIMRKFETKDCRLESDNNGYRGRCTSDAGEADEYSTICMYPESSTAEAVCEELGSGDGDLQVGGGEFEQQGTDKKDKKDKKGKKIEIETREVKTTDRGKKNKD